VTRVGCPTRDSGLGADCDSRQAGTEASQTRVSVSQDPNQKSRAGLATVTRFSQQPHDHQTSPYSCSRSAGKSARQGQAQQGMRPGPAHLEERAQGLWARG